jgi:hypothetical protein
MLTAVEFALVHVRTEDCPFRIEAGDAERVQVDMSVVKFEMLPYPVPAELVA